MANTHAEVSDFVILKVDLKNAFNMVSRRKMLEIVVQDFPDIARWCYWCYGGTEGSHLWFDRWVLHSLEGVQQGDPLGPLLFSMVIHRVIAEIHQQCPNLPLNKWYLDDGIMGGSTDGIARALSIIEKLGPNLGLNLNLAKCELIYINTPCGPVERDPFPSQIKRLYQNFEILGIPIGDAQFCSKYVRDKCSFSAFRAIDAITTLDDPQVTQMLLRLCASYCKIVHFLRGVPCSFIKTHFKSLMMQSGSD